MSINLSIKHGSVPITDISSGTVTLQTGGKYCEDNLSFTLSGVEYWEGDVYLPQLCFTANTAESTIAMTQFGTTTLNQNFQTSTDGFTWTTFTPGSTTITLTNVGDKVYFKGNNPNGVTESSSKYYKFVMTGSITASGNIMSLIDNGACTTTTIPNNYCYAYMFYDCASLITAPELPAITLTQYCYASMFKGCSSLISAPELPATDLAQYCYYYMFSNCSDLTTASNLPAPIVDNYCYSYMFYYCTSLTVPPIISANTFATFSCEHMFQCCTSLTLPPVLSAMNLGPACYDGMFSNCSSLTSAPKLPATTLSAQCYKGMFSYCTALTKVPTLSSTTLTNRCYDTMFQGCSSLQVSDGQTVEATYAWTIPTSGVFEATNSQSDMFLSCAGTRSSNHMPGAAGQSYTYYTQNQPIS